MGQFVDLKITLIAVCCVLLSPVQFAGGCGGGAQADMVFIMDESGSVRAHNFVKMKEFVRDLVDQFDIGSNTIRVGVMKYSSGANTEFDLQSYYDKNAMKTRIMSITYNGGGTNTAGALDFCRNNMFKSSKGDRSAVPNIAIVLTDGVSWSRSQTASKAATLRGTGCRIFSVGIGGGVNTGELNDMATDPDSSHVFSVSSFSALGSITSAFQAQACPPVNGGWGNWGSYSSCTRSCGGGTYTRTRSCNNPSPSNGGSQCSGSGSQTSSCNTGGCPVHGGWGNWGSYSSCSKSCGSGTYTRTRSCNNPSPTNGGNQCSGSGSQTSSCTTGGCPVNGGWSNWGSYSSCTRSCGGGTYTRTRSCNNPSPANGGSQCSGSGSQTSSCNTASCPVNGAWGGWANWGSCTKSCGSGTKTRSRSCDSPAPAHGGSQCPGSGSSSTSCNTHSCAVKWGNCSLCFSARQLGLLGAWGSCSVTCAAGTKDRSRNCDNPAPAHGGNQCSGSASSTGSCNPGPCPIDGGWGAWQAWSACSVTCKGVGTQGRTRTCDSPTPQHGGAQCPGSGSDTQTCDFSFTLCSAGNGWAQTVYSTTPGTPVDGGIGSWEQWSPCTKTCGAGISLRVRKCNNPVPKFGGQDCTESFTQKRLCGNVACPNSGGYVQTCPSRFFDCQSGNRTCVHYLKKCDCISDCDDSSDEDPEWAGCTADSSVCSNRARFVSPVPQLMGLFLCVAVVLPHVWALLTP